MFTDITTYGKGDTERNPRVLEAFAGNIRFIIHKHINCGDDWLLTCWALHIEKFHLRTEDMGEAKEKGIKIMQTRLMETIEEYTKAIEDLERKEGKR